MSMQGHWDTSHTMMMMVHISTATLKHYLVVSTTIEHLYTLGLNNSLLKFSYRNSYNFSPNDMDKNVCSTTIHNATNE